jgi:hypothetical protein
VVLVELSSSDLKIDRTFCFKIGFKTMKWRISRILVDLTWDKTWSVGETVQLVDARSTKLRHCPMRAAGQRPSGQPWSQSDMYCRCMRMHKKACEIQETTTVFDAVLQKQGNKTSYRRGRSLA